MNAECCKLLPNIALLQTLTVWNTDGCTERYHDRIYLCFTFAALLQLVSMCVVPVCTVSVPCLVAECEMADFVTGSSSEKIPFVFLPLAGQLVYPR